VTDPEIPMKLFHSPASPYVRKCMVVAHECDLAGRLTLLPAAAHPVNRDRNLVASNPLGKVPTLLTDDGLALYDSRVICEYLDHAGGARLFPAAGPARWRALAEQALGDGILDAALLVRYEGNARPEALRWADWTAGQMDKIACGLRTLEEAAPGFGDRVDIGTITLACVLGYLDFRFAQLAWRDTHPQAAAWFARFEARPSMQATLPRG
jgi:glutathione S-transferase